MRTTARKNTSSGTPEVSGPVMVQPKGVHLSRSAPALTSASSRRMTITTTTSTTTTSMAEQRDAPGRSGMSLRESTKALFSLRRGRERPASTSFPSPTPSRAAPPLWLPLIKFLCSRVELLGRTKVGIFRTSAGAHTVRQLLLACDCLYNKRAGDEEMAQLFAPYAKEVDVLASVIKAYLREQPDPFIPMFLYESFLAALETDDLEERLYQIGLLISQLGRYRRRILHRFILLLHRIQEHQEENKMDASNLAIVFAPSLLRGEDEGLDMRKIRAQCQAIEFCILYHSILFQGDDSESESDGEEETGVDQTCHNAPSLLASSAEERSTGQCPHEFKKGSFSLFHQVACQHCHKSILRKAYQCRGCDYVVHSKCRQHADNTCTGVARASPTVVLLQARCVTPVVPLC